MSARQIVFVCHLTRVLLSILALLLTLFLLRGGPMFITIMVSVSLGFLVTFICFCVTVLFYRYLYFVVKKNKENEEQKLRKSSDFSFKTTYPHMADL